jgi:hypothetical protein
MKSLAIVAVCAGLAAAPIVAKAADLVLFDAAGRPVAVLVPTAETAATMMPTDIFAQQDAMLNRMMQTMTRMDAAFMSGPLSMDPAAFGNGQPGSTVITTSFSDGRSSCSRTVTYDQRGGGQSDHASAPDRRRMRCAAGLARRGCSAGRAPERTCPAHFHARHQPEQPAVDPRRLSASGGETQASPLLEQVKPAG